MLIGKSYIFIQENPFNNVVWKVVAILSRPRCVNPPNESRPCSHCCHVAMSLQLMWRSRTRRFHLRVPDLHMSCSDLIWKQNNQDSSSSNGHQLSMPSLIATFMGPHGSHLGPVVPRWVPCRPHEPCYLGYQREWWFLMAIARRWGG